MSEWISVEERLPDFDVEILMLVPTSINTVFAGFVKEVECDDCGWLGSQSVLCDQYGGDIGYDFASMTHWMPLPELPKDGK